MSEFTNDWFERQALPLWKKHLVPLDLDVKRYVEIGVCEGRSLLWVVEHYRPELAVGIDPYAATRRGTQAAYDGYYERAKKNLAGIECVRLIRQRSQDYLRSDACHALIPDGSVDLAYIDGGHWAWETIADAVLLWPKMRRGGIIVFDDLNRRWLVGRPQVRIGWRAFCDAFENLYETVYHEGRQMAARKLTRAT